MGRGLRTLSALSLMLGCGAGRVETDSVWTAMGQPAGAVLFDDEPFEDVVGWLREHGLRNIVIDWAALEPAGIDREARVALELHGLTVGEVLDEVLAQLAATALTDGERPAYSASERLLRITTRERLNGQGVVRVYNVVHLLAARPHFGDAPEITVAGDNGGGRGATGGAGRGGEGGDNGGGPLLTPGASAGTTLDFAQVEAAARANLVAALLQVRSQTWQANGQGGTGTIAVFGNRLVITQSLEMHELIGGVRSARRVAG